MSRSRQSLRVVARALEQTEVGHDSCLSAQEALESLARGQYSALALDFDLPGAAQVARLARLAPPLGRPVVFAIVGAATDMAGAYQAGANFLLYKPLDPDQVMRCVRAARGFLRADRRCSTRHAVQTVVYLLFGKNLALPTLMLDLNEQGFSIQAAQPLPDIRQVPVHFLLPGSTHPIAGTAEVIWADDSGRAGMFFSQMASPTQRYLKNWLNRRKDKDKESTLRRVRAGQVKAQTAAISSQTR